MTPLKATLFMAFCLASVAAMGTTFSHFWRTNKKFNQVSGTLASIETIKIPLIQTEIPN